MSAVLVCSVPFDLSSGSPVCPSPGVVSSVDLSVIAGAYSTSLDPVIAVEAFGSGLVIAGVPLVLVMCLRIVLSSFFGKH